MIFPPNRHVRQESLAVTALRQGQTSGPGEHKSSPRPGTRDGMKQEPYESRAVQGSKGEATNGDLQTSRLS